jgi:hypothetical protein
MTDKNQLLKFGDIKETKHYTQVIDKSLKKALIMKRCVHLEDANKPYSTKMRSFKVDEVKKRHMGKVKCIAHYKDDAELLNILEMYFL